MLWWVFGGNFLLCKHQHPNQKTLHASFICNMRNSWRFSCLQEYWSHCTCCEGRGFQIHIVTIYTRSLSYLSWFESVMAGAPYRVLCRDRQVGSGYETKLLHKLWNQQCSLSYDKYLKYQKNWTTQLEHKCQVQLKVSPKSKTHPVALECLFPIFWGEYVPITTLCILLKCYITSVLHSPSIEWWLCCASHSERQGGV